MINDSGTRFISTHKYNGAGDDLRNHIFQKEQVDLKLSIGLKRKPTANGGGEKPFSSISDAYIRTLCNALINII